MSNHLPPGIDPEAFYGPPLPDDPFQSAEYQAFVESMVPHCRCEYDRPCDGVLAGGLCDERKEEEDRHPDDSPLDEEDRNEC